MASVESRVLTALARWPSSLSCSSRSEYFESSEFDRARALASSPPKTEATNSETPCDGDGVSGGHLIRQLTTYLGFVRANEVGEELLLRGVELLQSRKICRADDLLGRGKSAARSENGSKRYGPRAMSKEQASAKPKSDHARCERRYSRRGQATDL